MGQGALGSYPFPSHLWLGSAVALLAGSPLVFCAVTSPPEPLCRNCQLLSPSAQPAEQLSLLTQNLETYFLFYLHLVFSVLTL